MGQNEIGGYVLVAGYGLLLLGSIKVFGARRVMRFMVAIIFVGVWVAMGTLRGLTARRY